MRQTYETKADRANELQAITEYAAWQADQGRSWEFDQRGSKAHTDFYIKENGEIIAEAEVKCRNIRFDDYPTQVIGANKIEYAQEIYKMGRRFVLLVKTIDRLASYLWEPGHDLKTVIGGRTRNTRDSGDIYLVVYIPCTHFRTIRIYDIATRGED